MRFPTLAAWLEWQAGLHPKTIDLGLDRVRAVWRRLGTPSLGAAVISVAGTNGKGSSVAFIEAMPWLGRRSISRSGHWMRMSPSRQQGLQAVLDVRTDLAVGDHADVELQHLLARDRGHGIGACGQAGELQAGELSGGERQRVSIATLLAQQTELMLLDEPSNHLDLHHRVQVLDTLVSHGRETNSAVLMALHDINLAARFADHVLLLLGNGESCLGRKEQILETAALERLYDHPLTRVETPLGPAWLPQ